MSSQTRTAHRKGVIPSDVALAAYLYLVNNIQWIEGVRSKYGFTRLARPVVLGENVVVDYLIQLALKEEVANINFIYINYYKDGSHWCPNHTHPGTRQIVISLGATRILQVGKKEYAMENGDAIIFGSSVHGVKKEPTVTQGRIAIAVILEKR